MVIFIVCVACPPQGAMRTRVSPVWLSQVPAGLSFCAAAGAAAAMRRMNPRTGRTPMTLSR